MTELEKLQYAKGVIDKMANGIDPLADKPVAEGDLVNNVRISRCLFYVSDVLRQVIDNGGTEQKRKTYGKRPFSITQETLKDFPFSETPVTASELCKRLSDAVHDPDVKKLTYNMLCGWLMERELLVENTDPVVRCSKVPTPLGRELGISVEVRHSMRGEYDVVVYTRAAQQFIVDNIDSLCAYILENTKLKSE